MADEILIFDKAGSLPDGTDPGSPLSIGPGTSYPVVDAQFPAPPINVQYSSNVDTEGELPISNRHGNRTISLTISVDESGAVNTLADALAGKFAKLQREGGTLHRTRKDGSVRIYDILAGDGWQVPYDQQYILAHSADVPFSLPAAPYARGAEADLGDNVETTLPALVFTDASIAGDVSALGRVVIDNDAASDWWGAIWGIESNQAYAFTTSSGAAGALYEAETRTLLSGSTTTAGPAGASGTVVFNGSLAPGYQAIVSTQATGGGAHLAHVGTFRVFARVYVPNTNAGSVKVALEWAGSDFRSFTQNDARTLPMKNIWQMADLGLVTSDRVMSGPQRWEGRVIAASTVAGDDINIDWLMLVPVADGYAETFAAQQYSTPTSVSARDEFDQTAGALAGKVAPVGGTWAGAGDTDDFVVETAGHTATRDAVSDTVNVGRYAVLGTATFTNVTAEVNTASFGVPGTTLAVKQGLLLRYIDTSNYLFAGITCDHVGDIAFYAVKVVAGTRTVLAQGASGLKGLNIQQRVKVRALADAAGRWMLWVYGETSDPGAPVVTGQDTVLATSGTLASGKVGMYDENTTAIVFSRTMNDFLVSVPVLDAAVFAGQSLQVKHDSVAREDSAGVVWDRPGRYQGDYLRVPPSRAEGRSVRMVVKPIYHPGQVAGVWIDDRIDDLSARLYVTARYV